MGATAKEILKIDKTNWTTVKFNDVVFEPKESTKDPLADGIVHVVGLEHIESQNIHLRNSATIEESTTFSKKFAIDDVLFGRRRAYLKKAAQASFSGICSGDITVFRTKDNLMPELLPFLVNNENFFDYAIRHSAGGLSPRVKFKDLANYEFLLPPKDQQAQLAELLWAMDEVIEREKGVLDQLNKSYSALVDNLFSVKNENWDFIRLDKIASINFKSLSSKTDPNYEFEYLDLASIIEPKVIGELKKIKLKNAPSRAKRVVKDDSIILAMVRPYQKAFAYVNKGQDIIASTGTAVVNTNDQQISHFVFHQFFSKRFSKYCEDRMTGTSYPAITPKDVEEYKIAMPKDREIILRESEKLNKLDVTSINVKSKISSSQSLQKSLINQVFS
jgi:type I restriction enzyme S subunit